MSYYCAVLCCAVLTRGEADNLDQTRMPFLYVYRNCCGKVRMTRSSTYGKQLAEIIRRQNRVGGVVIDYRNYSDIWYKFWLSGNALVSCPAFLWPTKSPPCHHHPARSQYPILNRPSNIALSMIPSQAIPRSERKHRILAAREGYPLVAPLLFSTPLTSLWEHCSRPSLLLHA